MSTTSGNAGGTSRARQNRQERLIQALLAASALLSVLITAGIVLVLMVEGLTFFGEVSIWEFLTGNRWTPLLDPRHYGVLPLVCGTLLVTAGSCLIAIPFGIGTAIYLSEYSTRGFRSFIKPILEILAGIPTVVYGYFALTTVTPFLQRLIPETQVFNAASAAIVMGIMILPLVASLCDDAFRAVPQSLRQGAFALGATRMEVATRVVLPAALSGVLASFVLAVSRAIGETMVVAMAAGSTPKLTLNPLESIQTMTGYIVQVSLGDTPAGTTQFRTIFAVGMLLFGSTLALNLLAHRILRRFHEVYE